MSVTTKSFSEIRAADVEIGETLCERRGSDIEPVVIGKVLWIEPDMLGTERTFYVAKGKRQEPHPFANDAQVWVAD